MANECSTKYMFFGDKEHIEDLQNKILKVQETKGAFLCTLAKQYSINSPDTSYRGHISYMDMWNEDGTALMVETINAWNPVTELFNAIINKHYLDDQYTRLIDFVYMAEEPGFNIYINTDIEGRFFSDRFYVDSRVNDLYESDYMENEQDVIDWLKKTFKGIPEFTTLEEFENCKSVILGEDDYINIYEFEVE